jgi:hypothetical protein
VIANKPCLRIHLGRAGTAHWPVSTLQIRKIIRTPKCVVLVFEFECRKLLCPGSTLSITQKKARMLPRRQNKLFGASAKCHRHKKCVPAAARFTMYLANHLATRARNLATSATALQRASQSPLRRGRVRCDRRNRRTIRDRRGCARIADWHWWWARRRARRGTMAEPTTAAAASIAEGKNENRHNERRPLHDCVSVRTRNIR